MARSDEAEMWFNAVYEAVQEIPHGRVTSYAHIARLLGRREYNLPSGSASCGIFEISLTTQSSPQFSTVPSVSMCLVTEMFSCNQTQPSWCVPKAPSKDFERH